jgi:hypothetical protein
MTPPGGAAFSRLSVSHKAVIAKAEETWAQLLLYAKPIMLAKIDAVPLP